MQVRLAFVRGGIAVLAAAAAVMVGAPAALADDGAARGRVSEHGTGGFKVNLEGGGHASTELFGFKLSDGSALKLYCVQISVYMRNDVDMVEQPWNKYPDEKSPFNANRDKLNWVLHHGYPGIGLDALGKTLTKAGAKLNGGLSDREAITATQAAVWHFSDGKNLDHGNPLGDGDKSAAADVVALYDYLTGSENTGAGQQPKPTLNIAAPKAPGAAGTKIGPFDVATTGDITSLTTELPDGVKVTDAGGKELKSTDVKDGTKLFVDVPADAKPGKGSFSLKVSGHLDTGRLFVSENYAKQPAQSLIVADSEKTQVTAKAAVEWAEASAVPSTTAPAPSTPAGSTGGGGDLANTGVDAAVPFTIGGLLLGGGALMLLLNRRRSRA
ncbi:thioester domain-containing protein [Amycolatopsis sp. cmx-4-68]|uniref:thioester domain-containing protein n=1 Tax=Amycolatopsis sp. cmx-4-68 TaxID=2790938 RepID=UPI00397ABEC1